MTLVDALLDLIPLRSLQQGRIGRGRVHADRAGRDEDARGCAR